MPDSPSPEIVLPLVREVVDELAARQPEFSEELTASISEGFEPLAHLPVSTHVHLMGGVYDNVQNVLGWLRDGRSPEHDEISPAGRAYLHDLARHEVPTIWVRRAYHLASEALLAEFFAQVEQLRADGVTKLHVFRHIAAWLHRYVDRATRLVAQAHEAELAGYAERHQTEVLDQVHRVMKGEPVDADAFAALTGHALGHTHLGVV